MSQDQSNWIFEIRDQNGANPVRIINARNRSVSVGLNQAGEANFELDLNDAKATESNLRVGRSQLYIYRSEELYFSGQIMIVERMLEQSTQAVRVKALGWLYLLSKRIFAIDADDEHTSEDAGAIAWGLINTTQSETYGSLGITQGTIETSNNLTITYTRQNVLEAIEELSQQAGIEFEVSANKIFNVFYPLRGSDKSNTVIFKYPGSIQSIRSVDDATTIVNNENGLGKGVGSQETLAERDDVGSQSVFGLYQKISSYKNVDNVTTLGNMVEYDIALYKAPRLTLDIAVHGNTESPSLSDYGIGDSVRIKTVTTNYNFSQVFRIFEIHVSIDQNDKESIRLIVALI